MTVIVEETVAHDSLSCPGIFRGLNPSCSVTTSIPSDIRNISVSLYLFPFCNMKAKEASTSPKYTAKLNTLLV